MENLKQSSKSGKTVKGSAKMECGHVKRFGVSRLLTFSGVAIILILQTCYAQNAQAQGVNLVPFGPEAGDQEVLPGMLTGGQTIDMHMFFPFYGGLYNYSVLSVNGYIAFATVLDQGPTINVGVENTDWPQQQDPAMIAPYLCKQQIDQNPTPGMHAGVFYRLMLRQSLFGRGSDSNINYGGVSGTGSMHQSSFFSQKPCDACPSTSDAYVHCNQQGDYFLDEMMRWLQGKHNSFVSAFPTPFSGCLKS
ncbi:unnamed protein product [Anisakis simplex]|uniref:Protein mesh (inferred by orthology to a D. melanogaster protein) n=1 Tax=Anisakis simplex TaxID=6269 RepID=A0A0M3KH44_ANISI|nr:unnamed protein product [Anisakis simplex]